jgi:PDZ domain/Activator of Hsp90 ATPase homolog 1-like protein
MEDGFEATFVVDAPTELVWERLSGRKDDLWRLPAFEGLGEELHVDPGRRLHVRKVTEPCAGTEIVITLQHEGSGTKVTVVQSGFGAMWTFAADALEVGWRHILADLALYLERGVHGSRHMRRWGNFGCVFKDTDFGLEVVSTMGDSLAQRVGLAPGDVVIAVAGAPVVTRAELESLMRVLPSGETVEVEWVRGDSKLEAKGAV